MEGTLTQAIIGLLIDLSRQHPILARLAAGLFVFAFLYGVFFGVFLVWAFI